MHCAINSACKTFALERRRRKANTGHSTNPARAVCKGAKWEEGCWASKHRGQRAFALLALQVVQIDLYPVHTNVDDVVTAEVQKAVRPRNAEDGGDQGQQKDEVRLRGDSRSQLMEHRDRQGRGLLMLLHVPFQPGNHAIRPRLIEGTEVTHFAGPLDDGPPIGLGGLVGPRAP